MDISLGFENIAIQQQKNKCLSRLDVDIESEIVRGIKRPIPLIAANMSTVCNAEFCCLLYQFGALGILHRADTRENLIQQTRKIADQCEVIAVSVGIGEDQFDLAVDLIRAGANIIVIDIAHGYCDAVINLCKRIKAWSNKTKVIVGNTVNENMLYEVNDCADAIKVGIGQGSVCETAFTAGCTEKQWSSVYKMKAISKELGLPVISDGGIKQPADFVKAIGAGANSCMAGGIFCACPESAGEIVIVDGNRKKIYAGMASRFVQDMWKGGLKDGTCPEGTIKYLDIGESVESLLQRYVGALRSGITYAGGTDIVSFQKVVEFIRLT